ncbi:MAG: hypothetical protein ACJAR6_000111 [Oleispira sp.]|jgi:hypothetical protein
MQCLNDFILKLMVTLLSAKMLIPIIATTMFRQWSDNAKFSRLWVQSDIDSLMLSQFKITLNVWLSVL